MISQLEKELFNNNWKAPKILTYEEDSFNPYGYIEFIQYTGHCKNIAEAKKLYYQFGKLLAYGKLFKISDGHADNVIVNYPNITWIDLETTFHTYITNFEDIHPLEITGLLYNATEEKTILGIVTAIQGGRIPRVRVTRPTIVNDGQDIMSIRYFGLLNKVALANQIFLNNQLCKAEDYISDIQEGYKNTVHLIIKNKQTAINKMTEYIAKGKYFRTRFLCVVTACYSRYIALLQHYMSASKNILSIIRDERETLLKDIEPSKRRFIIENEIGDLCIGVIPYFYRKINSTDLYHTSGASYPDFFKSNQLTDIVQHIENLSLDDIPGDISFIEKALLSTACLDTWDDFAKKFNFPIVS